MFSLGSQHQYYLYKGSCDMRKGFDGLSGLVTNELGRSPMEGSVFVFINKQRIHPTNYTSISLKFWGSRVSIWFIFTLSMFFRANINHSVGLTLCFLHIPKNV